MEIKSHNAENVMVLELDGRFDAYETPKVSQWLSEHIAPDTARLVVNLNAVNFIDSIALAVLVKTIMRCKENGGDLHLCSVSKPVRIILELTLLHKVFSIYDDESSAISSFQ